MRVSLPSSAMLVLALASSRAALAFSPGVGGALARRALSTRLSATDGDFAEYSAKTTFFFPGQGAQTVGMASTICDEVPAAKELFDKASSVLGYDLLEKCKEGPKEVLDSTAVSQPAIFVCSMAALEKLKLEEGGKEAIDNASCAMGLSLGEYSALCFAGALSFEDGVKLTKIRGEAMQAAADATNGGMVSVIGLGADVVAQLCEEAAKESGKPVAIANYLCDGNYAVSGAKEALEVVIAKAPEYKARMTVPLAVAGAFHTDFMGAAVPTLQEALSAVTISKPRIPVISNVDAKPHSDPAVIKEILAKQVTNPVQFETSVKTLMDKGYETGYECGPGKVVAGIMKRINRKAAINNVTV